MKLFSVLFLAIVLLTSNLSAARKLLKIRNKLKNAEGLKTSEFEIVLEQKKGVLDELFKQRNELLPSVEQESTPTTLYWEDTLAEDAEKVKLIKVAIIDLRIHQIETLHDVLNSTLQSIKKIVSEADSTFGNGSVSFHESFRQIQEQNNQIASDTMEAAYNAQNELKESLEKEQSINKLDEKKHSDTLVDSVMSNLEGTVERLEESFQKGNKFSDGKKYGKLQAVVKVDDDEEEHETSESVQLSAQRRLDIKKPDELGPVSAPPPPPVKPKTAGTIIDSDNNQFVLTRANDPTAHIEDARLFNDIVLLVFCGFVLGLMFDFFRLPAFFGFIFSGIILGPSYLNKLRGLIQIATIAQFGVLFILFLLGMEFSMEKLKSHWRVTVIGGCMIFCTVNFFVIVLGSIYGNPLEQLVFIGVTISLSSTTVVSKCIGPDHDSLYARIIIGILVLQDLVLGLFLAGIPILAIKNASPLTIITELSKIIFKSIGFLLLSYALGITVVSMLIRFLKGTQSHELQVLGAISVSFGFLYIAEYFGLSEEFSVFVAGAVFSHCRPHAIDAKTLSRIEAIRDFFGCLFFASIGIHIYPMFLIQQAPLLITATLLIMAFKTAVSFVILKFVMKCKVSVAVVASVGMSQISEFAFVLASRAKALQVLNKEAYYLILGITSLSLLVTPFAWKVLKRFNTIQTVAEKAITRADDFMDDNEVLRHLKNSLGNQSHPSSMSSISLDNMAHANNDQTASFSTPNVLMHPRQHLNSSTAAYLDK